MLETVLIIVSFALVLIFTGIKMVPQGHAWTIERFGRYTRTINAGLHLLVPFMDRIGHKLITMEQVLDVEPQEVISADNAMVTTDAVCFYQIQSAEQAAYEVNDLERALYNLVMTNIRAVLGSMDLDEMLSKRDKINSQILIKVDEATNPWGVKVTRIEIKDITPPRDLVDAMALQMKAEREKRATVTEAEGQREAAIRVAEGQRESDILRSQGELEAAKNDAAARERLAEAEANATRTVSEAITHGGKDAINYFIAQGYTKALQEIAASENSKVIMMPLEASSLIGSVAGIKDILEKVGEEGSS
ncbi:MAG: SPFH/Band 7/PHB domain protein [Halieaceae bacterium]|jgi:regulator of protease activity HflC (stomatin/prohibitin superfamily)|nr:SPFH/Band 7/PHB domain protein [Halieaceae bacterium]